MTKKEFRKKCKKEKTVSYQLSLWGTIIALFALILLIAALIFVKTFSMQLFYFRYIIIIALIGAGLDIAGDVILAKNFKEFQNKQ